MRSYVLRAPAAALLTAVIALTACGAGPDGSGGGGEGSTTLRLALPQEPPDWDFIQGAATAARRVVALNVVEPLMEMTDDGELTTLLAKSLEVNKAKTQYTFTLRETTFHDGKTLGPADVVYSLEQSMNSPLDETKQPFAAVTSISASGDSDVVVSLSRPSASFLPGMASVSGLVIPEGSADQLAKSPIGTGPFEFGEWKPGTSVSLTRFKGYWGSPPEFENVDIRFITDETTAVNALLAGDLDMVANMLGAGRERVATFEKDDAYSVTVEHTTEKVYLSLNAKDPTFSDRRIVEALNYALDRDAVVDGALAGIGTPICIMAGDLEPGGLSDGCPYEYDPAKAKQLLEDANAAGTELTVTFPTTAYFPGLVDVVVSQLTEAGFTVKTDGIELATYLERVLGESPDYQITTLGGPQAIDTWRCPGWFTQNCNEEMDNLLDQADRATTDDDYQALRGEALQTYAGDGYLIALAAFDTPTVTRAGLEGVSTDSTAIAGFDLRKLRWE